MKEKFLYLNVNRKWFNEIANNLKKCDYREFKPYWISRISNKKFTHAWISNGYRKGSSFIIVPIEYIDVISIMDLPLPEMLYFTFSSTLPKDQLKKLKFYRIKLGELEIVER